MITNFTIGPNPGGLARYLLGYKDKKADKQATILGSGGVRTDTLAHLIKDFELGSKLHPELGLAVLHVSLSFNPDDAARMTDQKMRQVAEDYMDEMGMKGTQYLLVRHRDRPHQHLHIMANRVADDGHTLADSNNFMDSKTAVAKLMVAHELSPAQGRRPHLQHPERLRGKDLGRHGLRTALDQALHPEQTQRPAYLAALEAEGVACREFRDKDGNVTGISFKKGGYACKGSALGPEYSSAGIDQRLAANQQKALEATGQREPTTLAGPAVTAAGADAARSPALLPAAPLAAPLAVGPARGEAAVVADSLFQSAVGGVKNNRPVGPTLGEVPSVLGPVPGVARPNAPGMPGVISGQREPAPAPPLVPAVPVEVPVRANAGATVSGPGAQPSSPKGTGTAVSDPLAAAEPKPVVVPATGKATPAPAEARVLPPATAAASTSPVPPVALAPAVALPGGQAPTAVNVTKGSEPARADEPLPSPPAIASPTGAAGTPAAYVTATSDFEEKLARWEAQQLAGAEADREGTACYAWLKLGAQVQGQATAAAHEALATGAAFLPLLDRHGLGVRPAAGDEPVGVHHRASGEFFPPAVVSVPALLLTPAGQATAQYGLVQMDDTDERPAAERLARVRAHLVAAGLTVGLVEPAEADRPARLAYAFDPYQADLARVAAGLHTVQADPRTWVLEAPHALHSPPGQGYGHAVPRDQWPAREGQFNQARLEIDNADERAPSRADHLRRDLGAQGVALGPLQTEAPDRLAFDLRYHTRAPGIDAIASVLYRAQLSDGIGLRESEPQHQARASGTAAALEAEADQSQEQE